MKKTKNQKSNKLLKFLLLVLVYLGVFLVCFPIFRNMLWVEKTTTIKTNEIQNLAELETIPFETIKAPSIPEIMRSKNEYQSIGQIYLPNQAIDLPVFAGLSQTEMIFGAAAMYPERDPKKDNLVIVGHHLGYTDVLFGKLLDAKAGEKIYLRYLGEYFAYQIQSIEVVKENQVKVLEKSTKPLLTLLTCDRGTTTKNRVVIKAFPLVTNKDIGLKTIQTELMSQQKNAEEKKRQLQLQQIWLPAGGMIIFLMLASYLIIKKV